MSGPRVPGSDGYEHAGGYKPVPITALGIAGVTLAILVYFLARDRLDLWLGRRLADAALSIVFAPYLGWMAVRLILNADRFAGDGGADDSARERRNLRLWGMAVLIVATVIATIAVQNLFQFLPE